MYSFNFHSVVLLHLFSTARIGSHALFQVVYYSVLQTSWHVVANIPQTSMMFVMLTRSIVFFTLVLISRALLVYWTVMVPVKSFRIHKIAFRSTHYTVRWSGRYDSVMANDIRSTREYVLSMSNCPSTLNSGTVRAWANIWEFPHICCRSFILHTFQFSNETGDD